MKMAKKLFILIACLGLILAGKIQATTASTSINEVIPLRLKAGLITEAEFPEKIASVTKGISSELLQMETLGNRLFLLPRENLDSRIYVVTQDNVSYCLQLIMDEIHPPTRIKINKPRLSQAKVQDKSVLNTIELMKALLNNQLPAGAVSLNWQNREIFNNGDFRITADEVYELAGGVNALVLTFENLTHKPVVVPIEHIELPGLLAISVDSQILEARPRDISKQDSSGYTTKAYMIVRGVRQ